MVAIVTEASIEAAAQEKALISEAQRRRVALPRTFDVPDRPLWQPGYRAAAKNSLLRIATTLDDALEIVRGFADPLFNGKAIGNWDPKAEKWRE